MSDKKLWTRADIRAEMNRVVKGTTDACKAIHDAAAKIEALGKESGFEGDATRAWAELRRRVFPGVKETKPTGTWLVEQGRGGPTPLTFSPKVIRRIENEQALREALKRPVYTPAGVKEGKEVVPLMVQHGRDGYHPVEQHALETWGERGCTCAASHWLTSAHVMHSQACSIYLEKYNKRPALPGTWSMKGCTCTARTVALSAPVIHAQDCRVFQETQRALAARGGGHPSLTPPPEKERVSPDAHEALTRPPYERFCASSISSAVAMLPGCPQGIWISKRAGWSKEEATIVVQHQPENALPFFVCQGNHLNIWGVVGEAGLARLMVEFPDEKILMVTSRCEGDK
jgi:hypothetical protein